MAAHPARLGSSLADFIGHPGYGTAQLCQDLNRFVFLLGGSDGEPPFGPRSCDSRHPRLVIATWLSTPAS